MAALSALAVGRAASAAPALSDAQQVVAALQFPPSALHVIGGVAGGGAKRAGEPIVLSVEVSRPAYVAVLRVARTGDTTEIFPSRRHPDAHVGVGAPLRITVPSAASAAGEPKAAVLFEFIAAADGGSWLFHPQPAAGAEFAQFGPTTRALARDIRSGLRRSAASGVATAYVSVPGQP